MQSTPVHVTIYSMLWFKVFLCLKISNQFDFLFSFVSDYDNKYMYKIKKNKNQTGVKKINII